MPPPVPLVPKFCRNSDLCGLTAASGFHSRFFGALYIVQGHGWVSFHGIANGDVICFCMDIGQSNGHGWVRRVLFNSLMPYGYMSCVYGGVQCTKPTHLGMVSSDMRGCDRRPAASPPP